MDQQIYHIVNEEGYYIDSAEARLDPAAALRGKKRYLMPKRLSTQAALPEEVAGYRRRLVDGVFIQEKIIAKEFTVEITKEVETNAFASELDAAGIWYSWGVGKSIIVRQPDTPENRAAVDAVIAAHDKVARDKGLRERQISFELAEIDRKSIRSIRAYCAGRSDSEDIETLTKHEADAKTLRDELAALKA